MTRVAEEAAWEGGDNADQRHQGKAGRQGHWAGGVWQPLGALQVSPTLSFSVSYPPNIF